MKEKTTRDCVRVSFLAGYHAVKHGKIQMELTNGEIEHRFPEYISNAFAEGMLDALKNDHCRADRLMP